MTEVLKVEWLIADGEGNTKATGWFKYENAALRREFAIAAKEAWEKGYCVITRKLPATAEG